VGGDESGLPEERAALQALLDLGITDSFSSLISRKNPTAGGIIVRWDSD
jgi:hypothetical protein